MAIFTAEELLKKHGVKPEDVKSVDVQETAQAGRSSFTSRVGTAINQRGQNVNAELNNSAQNPLVSGIKATGQAFGGIADVANEAIQSVPGVRDAVNFVGEKAQAGFKSVTDTIADTKLFTEASQFPEQTKVLEDFLQAGGSLGDIVNNILLAKGVANTAQTGVNIAKTAGQKVGQGASLVKDKLTPTPEQIALERKTKMTQGLEEQNTRLKSADKSFNKNTIVRKTKDGKLVKITPIDTFVKHDIAPVIDKGSIQMGDYKTGIGELGKIKTKVSNLDAEIDTKLVNSGHKISLEDVKTKAIQNAKKNDEFKQSGSVSQNVAKIESRFADYGESYGDTIDIAELNNIRKLANKDFSPDTHDISRIVGDTAREYVYKTTPDGSVRSLLQKQGELLTARKYAETINGTKVTGGRLGNMALRGAGAVVGTTVQGLPVAGPLLGMIGGEFAARALQQSQFKSLWTELRAVIAKEAQSPHTTKQTPELPKPKPTDLSTTEAQKVATEELIMVKKKLNENSYRSNLTSSEQGIAKIKAERASLESQKKTLEQVINKSTTKADQSNIIPFAQRQEEFLASMRDKPPKIDESVLPGESVAQRDTRVSWKKDIEKMRNTTPKYSKGDSITVSNGKKFIVDSFWIENGKMKYDVHTPGKKNQRGHQFNVNEVDIIKTNTPKPDLSTDLLSKLEGRTTVSKQFISDHIKSSNFKQSEKDVIQKILDEYTHNPDVRNLTFGDLGKIGTIDKGTAPVTTKSYKPKVPTQVDFDVEKARLKAQGKNFTDKDVAISLSKLEGNVKTSVKNDVHINVTEFSNKVRAKTPLLPKPTDPLTTEALKYKSAEEFVKAQGTPFEKTMYSGSGGGGLQVARPEAGNALGEGKYYAGLSQASRYGKNITETKVSLQNPLYITTDQELRNITNSSSLFRKNPSEQKAFTDSIKQKIVDMGHDGVVVKMRSYQDSQYLQQLFGHDQVIDYGVKLPTKSQLTDIWNKAKDGQK